MTRWVLAAVWIGVLSVGGCVKPSSVTCDEVVCPRDTMCNERFGCVTSVQAEVCEGQPDGTMCSYTGVENGVCGGGICTPAGCGNAVIDTANGEDCDGATIGDTTCEDLGAYAGTLSCTASCRFDTSTCGGFCGDGITQASEQCDSTVPGDKDCTNARTPGFYGGTLGCLPNCKFDYSDCAGTCGDGAKTANEACDGSDFGGDGCQAHGFYTGALSCSTDCQTVADTACTGMCGDSTLDGTELCDGNDRGEFTCESIGYYSAQGAQPDCNSTCNGVTKGTCSGFCGDGVVNGNELCDGLAQGAASCTGFGASGGALGCDGLCQRSFEQCLYPDILAPKGSPTVYQIEDIAAVGPNDIWIVGLDGAFHGDGDHWRKASIAATDLHGLFARTSTDVWAVGGTFGSTSIYRFNGATWTQYSASASVPLFAVWAPSANDAWAVGSSGVVRRFDGTSFQTVPSGSTSYQLSAVWGSGPSDVWMGGYDSSNSTGLLLHWTGSSFATPIPFPNGTTIEAIWGTASDDVWLATGQGIYHHGASPGFTQVSALSGRDIDGTGPDDIWIVGNAGQAAHYDGVSWTPVESGVSTMLAGVAAVGTNNVWAVGLGGTIAHWSGSPWKKDAFDAGQRLNAMWGAAYDDIWAVGASGTIVHYDGTAWSTYATSPTTSELLDIWGSAANDIWAVGLGAGSGVIIHYNGSSWTTTTTVAANLWRVHGSGPNDVWAGGDGIMMHYTGSWATITPAPTTRTVGGLWAMSPTQAWAIASGSGGTYMTTWNGSTWSTEQFSTAFGGPWGAGPGDLWITTAAGQPGISHLHAGGFFDSAASPNETYLGKIWGLATDDIWAAPGPYHFDGAAWALAGGPSSLATDGISDFWGAASNDVWAVTSVGTIYHWTGTFSHTGGGASCGDVVPIYCGSVLTDTYFGSTANHASRFSSYSCGTRNAVGPETIYRFDTPVNGNVTFTLTPVANDLDLVVLGEHTTGSNIGCNPAACLAASQTAGLGAEMVTRTATKAETIFVVVDSVTASTSGYSLEVECTKSTSM